MIEFLVECVTLFHNLKLDIVFVVADAKETARQKCHASLRDTCAAGDVSLLKNLLQQLGSEAQLVVNMAPSGSNTLLFM